MIDPPAAALAAAREIHGALCGKDKCEAGDFVHSSALAEIIIRVCALKELGAVAAAARQVHIRSRVAGLETVLAALDAARNAAANSRPTAAEVPES